MYECTNKHTCTNVFMHEQMCMIMHVVWTCTLAHMNEHAHSYMEKLSKIFFSTVHATAHPDHLEI